MRFDKWLIIDSLIWFVTYNNENTRYFRRFYALVDIKLLEQLKVEGVLLWFSDVWGIFLYCKPYNKEIGGGGGYLRSYLQQYGIRQKRNVCHTSTSTEMAHLTPEENIKGQHQTLLICVYCLGNILKSCCYWLMSGNAQQWDRERKQEGRLLYYTYLPIW